MELQRGQRANILAKEKEVGEWHTCAICFKKRLVSSLEQLCYFIPSIGVNREIYYCADKSWCTHKAKERGKIPPRIPS